MKINDEYKNADNVNIKIFDAISGKLKEEMKCHNVAMNDWKNLTIQAWNTGTSLQVHYLGWGTGTTGTDPTRHQMTAEAGRKPISRYIVGSTGNGILSTTLTSNDANGVTIGELMLFGGSTATSTVNTGTPVAWWQWDSAYGGPHTKLSTESIQIDWTLTQG